MSKVIEHHPQEIVAFPREINPGVEPVNVAFEDFSLEQKDSEALNIGKVEIIHQKANPQVALQVVRAKSLVEFDKLLGKGMGMHITIQYVTGDYSFFVIFSGIQGDFDQSDTDYHVRLHRVFDAIRAGASWYHRYKVLGEHSDVSSD